MASATTTPTFTFHLSTSLKLKSKPNVTFPHQYPKTHSISTIKNLPNLRFITLSLDVSKEDKPTSEQPDSSPTPTPISEEFEQSELENFDQRRLEEKFAVLNTGIYECRSCGYRYNEAAGDPSYPIPPGMQFEKMPDDWRCPTCGAAKSFFQSKSVEIAGFAQNQQFGLGGNTLTSGQKAVVIYGSLFLGFLFFLSGYFLQ
ncbi:rubredoxin [Impatiens glandulifera]|uniref:rubredoxin n=1 Tax=Impatiens glandulifera TaxID=253017 RepID=UPI001FB19A4B|nr:rubredoxin [Impatiens glandulifera]